jgi:glycosyltransferase involved in cell wall biosynthesis
MRNKVSVIILTKNEEPVIRDCLESVKWADEIVVVDNYSTDGTLEIVKKYGAKVIKSKVGNNFADHRNIGAKAASGEWLLYVDADERVKPELKEEIQALLANDPVYPAYAIPRENIRLTKVLYHGGWWPDYVLRLIKKSALKIWVSGELHEQPEIIGENGYLKKPFLHFGHRGSFEHKLQNTINWSVIEAKLLFDSGHPPMNVLRFLSAMGREFFKRMVRLQAYRDGLEGMMEATYQVFSVFITYARLWEMQNKKTK